MEKDLAIIVKESGLEQSKAQIILEKFQDYFKMAAEWEEKAKVIKVTDESQEAEMKMAREGRLFLQKKRIEVEHTRKSLKEDIVRQGKAIDGIANILKAVIVPVEKYLEEQEKFVEFKRAKEDEAKRAEIEKRLEEERLEKERKEKDEQEKIRKENEELRKKNEEIEKKRKEEADKALEIQKKKDAELEKARKEAEDLRKKEAEKKLAEEKAIKEKEEAERKAKAAPDKDKLITLSKNLIQYELPEVSSDDAKAIIVRVKEYLLKLSNHINKEVEKL